MTPAVSVVLPAFNVAPLVGATVASLAAQDWPAIELIAVDDGSADGTADVLAAALDAFRGPGRGARLIRQANGGLGAARNVGLRHATADRVLFLDGDDLLDPGALSTLMRALDAAPQADIVFPRCRHIDEGGVPLGIVSPAPPRPIGAAALITDNPIHTDSGLLIRRAAIDRASGFDTALPSCIGIDFLIRATAGRGACILPVDAVLVGYRRRDGQITADWRRQRAGWTVAARRARDAGVLDARDWRFALARNRIVWATTAYRTGYHADARALMRAALRASPAAVLGDPHGRIRLAATLTTLLPPLHAVLVRKQSAPPCRSLGRKIADVNES
ncbi:hypothetical protein OCGS_2514 [Oceaniovalibus guishaninsula JLT2003]|uniref:Glycosyltransferase 2-like domain-containing protein n=1 Tax=Oceaniovalibus guishaninsula JLT2003 TaxID=1231392 RepID=K2H9S5_9RHOB|nr:glycosyltransferase family A protein [Oceaniovalibus guishaninsula]EKE43382.1 hypothetical protein OCGS_2514 [Oceaniovalibus guishaninsula JLT2003]